MSGIIWMERAMKVFGTAFILLIVASFPIAASAACRCACVDGQPQSICSNTLEIPVPCPPTVCPLVAPVNPVTTPPVGSQPLPSNPNERCQERQVYNPQTGQYELRRLCS